MTVWMFKHGGTEGQRHLPK